MFFLCFVVLALLPYQGFGQQCRKCPDGFTYYQKENKCYKVNGTKLTFDEASDTCLKFGAHLVVLERAADNDLLKQISQPMRESCINAASSAPGVWNAARKMCPKGPYFWNPYPALLTEMAYTNWLPGQPDNEGGNEYCIHMIISDSDFRWNNIPCQSPNCFICEYDM